MKYNAIILSGLPVSGKTTLAKMLSAHYNWPVLSIGQMWRDRWAEKYPEGSPTFEEYWRSTSIEDNLQINVDAKIFERGRVIGDTRYSIYCKEMPALLVLITADIGVRAERAINAGKYMGTMADVVEILEGREKDEVKMGKVLYGNDYDYRDENHYHMTLDSGKLSPKEEFDAITKRMKE